MATFKAIRIDKADKATTAALTQFDEAELMDGDVTVRVEYSTLNYKDGLALTGKAPVVRRWPMIPGVDFAGTVAASSHPDWKEGDKVVLNGWGLGETSQFPGKTGVHNGYGHNLSFQNVSGDFYLPASLSCKNCITQKDPRFVSMASADYRLQAGSPAVGAGQSMEGSSAKPPISAPFQS